MKILRSVTRRGFSVGTAGYFTGVLRPTSWFAASRLPDGARYFEHQSTWTATASAPGQRIPTHSRSQATTIPFQITEPDTKDRNLLRPALIVMAAIAITAVLLLWIMRTP
jgi:hypothetical protein